MATIQLYALHCGGDLTDMAAFDPFDPDTGTKVYNPYFMYVVKHPEGTLLFDSGAHPVLGTDPASRLGDAAADFQVKLSPDDAIEPRLASIGLTPADIDVVVESHLHFDHAGGLAWLTHAPILVQREELAFALNPPV
jgi:N-acyl homoserine lactone hydrolase